MTLKNAQDLVSHLSSFTVQHTTPRSDQTHPVGSLHTWRKGPAFAGVTEKEENAGHGTIRPPSPPTPDSIGEVFCGDPRLLQELFVPQDSHSSLIRESIVITKEREKNIKKLTVIRIETLSCLH